MLLPLPLPLLLLLLLLLLLVLVLSLLLLLLSLLVLVLVLVLWLTLLLLTLLLLFVLVLVLCLLRSALSDCRGRLCEREVNLLIRFGVEKVHFDTLLGHWNTGFVEQVHFDTLLRHRGEVGVGVGGGSDRFGCREGPGGPLSLVGTVEGGGRFGQTTIFRREI